MRPFQQPQRNFTRTAIALALLSAMGCGATTSPEKTPEDLEQLRTEMKATADRELSGSK
jgi:hypothetical protein